MTAPPEREAPPARPTGPPESEAPEVRARIAALEREARALEPDPRSARLYHELGLLWERPLGNLRAAAAAFQAAYRLAPRFVENLRSARRIFSDVGNWPMVLQLLDAELAATEGARPRAALLFEKAEVLADRLNRWGEATEVLAAALELEPADLGLLVQAEGMLAAHGDVAGLLRVQILLARALADPQLAAHALQTAAALHERLGQHPEALVRWHEAFALDRRDPVTLGALRRAAQTAGDDEALIAVLAAEAELGGPTSVPAYTALARAYVRQERPEDAVAALNAARHQNPADSAVLTALAALHESLERPEELADVLASLAESVRDEREWLTVQLRLTSLLEDTLHRDSQAVERYEAVLARVSGHPAALAGLGRLHAKTQDWPALVAVYDAELAGVGDPRTRAELHFRSAEDPRRPSAPDGRGAGPLPRGAPARPRLSPRAAGPGAGAAARAALDRAHRPPRGGAALHHLPGGGSGRAGPHRAGGRGAPREPRPRVGRAPAGAGPRLGPPPVAGPPGPARRAARGLGRAGAPARAPGRAVLGAGPRHRPAAPGRAGPRGAPRRRGRRHRRARAAPLRRPHLPPRAPDPRPALRARRPVEGARPDVPPRGHTGRGLAGSAALGPHRRPRGVPPPRPRRRPRRLGRGAAARPRSRRRAPGPLAHPARPGRLGRAGEHPRADGPGADRPARPGRRAVRGRHPAARRPRRPRRRPRRRWTRC